MTYLLQYVTGQSVGRVAIDGAILDDAIAKAEQALKGLPCISAVLRHASMPNPPFGSGFALAGFTPDEGWIIHEPPGS